MPKLKPDTQKARRETILDAAMQCFARRGFHATTIQHICKEAGISPGGLYVHFDSKEALIAGLCERDRAELSEHFDKLAEAPDVIAALTAIGEHYFFGEPAHKRQFVVEMGVESTRNPRIAEIFLSVDSYCRQSFERLFERLQAEGRIAPALDIQTLAKMFIVLGDGLFWRRAVDPNFDARVTFPVLIDIVTALLNPTEPMRKSDMPERQDAMQGQAR